MAKGKIKSKIPIKTPKEIHLMREVCQVTAQILNEVADIIKPNITTEDINNFVHNRTLELGAIPAPLSYKGFPKSVCTSVNEVICHGIPSTEVVLKSGDIVNVDVTSIKNSFYGDSSRMYFVGGESACSDEVVQLVKDTRLALYEGIKVVRPHARVGDIGAAIARFIKETGKGYGIVREYTGHGIGREFHELPQVVHIAREGTGDVLLPGMTFTIEPMINLGTSVTRLSPIDGWTVTTGDGKWSAQWEHTVLVTSSGVEILTEI
jgi:methionyl aminopeptidase